MKRYLKSVAILLLTLLSSAVNSRTNPKLSPYLNMLVGNQQEAAARQALPKGEGKLKVLIKLAEEADETTLARKYAFNVEARIGRVLIVSLPLSLVESMAADSQVLRIEAERAPRPLLNLLPQQIQANKAHEGAALPQAFTGKGVVVGIVDAGFDYIQPFFRDANGTTRVKWAADYLTGRKYTTTAEITAAQHCSEAEVMVHGTHVAGIAAGSPVNDVNDVLYRGIATEADIAEATVDSQILPDGIGLSSATSLQAFNDIFAWADEQNKPCVINYSMGDAMSFSDNRQLENEAIRTLLQKPGRALVVASGNSGNTSRLAHKEASMTEAGAGVCFNTEEQYGTSFGIELKVKPTQTIRLQYTDSLYHASKGETTITVQELETLTSLTLGARQLSVIFREKTADGYDIVYLTAKNTFFATNERVLLTIVGEGEAWIYADALCAQLENVPTYANHSLAQEGYSMTWPAELDETIAVGNIGHRFKILTAVNKYSHTDSTDLTPFECTKGAGYIAKSSSVGPTLFERLKPDVCAPGVNIVSALNNFINENTEMEYAGGLISHLDTEYEDGYGYSMTLVLTGTSMSAPAVTGTIALWMQADPTLTPERIKDVIAHSSRQPDSDLSYPNNIYGHGEIDAYKGLLYLLGLTDGIAPISQHQPQAAVFRLQGRSLSVENVALSKDIVPMLQVYTTAGVLVAQEKGTAIDLSSLPAGIYAVQFNSGSRLTTGSTLIRL